MSPSVKKKYLENIFIAVYFALHTVFKIYHLKTHRLILSSSLFGCVGFTSFNNI